MHDAYMINNALTYIGSMLTADKVDYVSVQWLLNSLEMLYMHYLHTQSNP